MVGRGYIVKSFQINIVLKSGQIIRDVAWNDYHGQFVKSHYSEVSRDFVEKYEYYDLDQVKKWEVVES